ncbi:hypothetical protein SK128_006556, partial [Halocaridina rubra]
MAKRQIYFTSDIGNLLAVTRRNSQGYSLKKSIDMISNGYGINTPPSLTSSKDWFSVESDPVGTIVNKLKAQDLENDHITFSLESQQPGGNIHTFFTIDEHQRVKIAKPLTGMAGSGSEFYFLNVRMFDGTIHAVTVIRLEVSKTNEGNPRGGGSRGGFGGIPDSFPNFDPPSYGHGPPPAFFTTHAFENRDHILTDVSVPFHAACTPLIDSFILHAAPPVLIVDRLWEAPADAEIGQNVSTVNVINTASLNYTLHLDGDQGLLKIEKSGLVKVAKSLVNQLGDLTLSVNVSNKVSSTSEPVVFRVTPPKHSVPVTSTAVDVSSTTVPQSRPSEGGKNSQDLFVLGVPSEGRNPGGSSSSSGSDEPKESPKSDINMTIIPIVIIAGISPVALALYCYWRKVQRKKARAEARESAVVYSEKGDEAVATQVPPRRTSTIETSSTTRSSLKINFAALWRRRVQSNKYEEAMKGRNGDRIDKRKMSEISSVISDNWEFPRHHLKNIGILGEGCFGQVWKCEAIGLRGKSSSLVAVKTLKESAGERERADLTQELKVLKAIGQHINVVSLLGCCTEKDPIFIILEYMIGGKLQSYLRASRADANYDNLHGSSSSLTPRDLTSFSYQIARGMDFLARHGIIHRDLAARNVLVGEDKICKVADFGFARDVANNRIYERKSDGRLPIRWMPPEALFDNIFTTKSDVWSFGVLLWEIVTLGSTPYPGLGASEVMKRVRDGYRLEKPDHCRRE